MENNQASAELIDYKKYFLEMRDEFADLQEQLDELDDDIFYMKIDLLTEEVYCAIKDKNANFVEKALAFHERMLESNITDNVRDAIKEAFCLELLIGLKYYEITKLVTVPPKLDSIFRDCVKGKIKK